MAIMLPTKPKCFEPNSLEDIMFEALSRLPDDYYVFHSFKIVTNNEGTLYESEADFIIFNRHKGVLVIEAKAGKVIYRNGTWFYGSGIEMNHDGPFNQASSNKWKLMQYLKNSKQRHLANKCKFLHAVWFPSIDNNYIKKIGSLSDADLSIILSKAALENPQPFIEKIFEIKLPNNINTSLSELERNQLLEFIFCPACEIFPSVSLDIEVKNIAFHRLLKEQSALLNYLEDQKTAVINGVAGTGKTMIALEKAKRHSLKGETVLFLCFNSRLKEYLSRSYSDKNIDFYTIDGFGCKLCNSSMVNYKKLSNVLENKFFAGSFKYKHIIIDEGQDFGQERIEESNIVELIKDIVIDESIGGSFYVFYDKLQLIQGTTIPKFISESDCKLTLYKNCRNTENISKTSIRPLKSIKPRLFDGCVTGNIPTLHLVSDTENVKLIIDKSIKNLCSSGIKDIVILTCATEETSIIAPEVNDGKYRKIEFTTCRKFKGLEAEAIILIDIDSHTFEDANVKLFYVGASRAKFHLEMIAYLSKEDCSELLINRFEYTSIPRKPEKEFSTALNSLLYKHS